MSFKQKWFYFQIALTLLLSELILKQDICNEKPFYISNIELSLAWAELIFTDTWLEKSASNGLKFRILPIMRFVPSISLSVDCVPFLTVTGCKAISLKLAGFVKGTKEGLFGFHLHHFTLADFDVSSSEIFPINLKRTGSSLPHVYVNLLRKS